MYKKITGGTLLVLILVIASFLAVEYIRYLSDDDPDKLFLQPRVEFSAIEIRRLTPEKFDMLTAVRIHNKLPFTFTADSFQYRLFMDSTEILRNTYNQPIRMPANDAGMLSFPVTVFYKDFYKMIKMNEEKRKDTIAWRLEAFLYPRLFFRKKLKVQVVRNLPVPFIPEVRLIRFKIDSLDASRAVIILRTLIMNKENVFPLKAENIRYEFSIEENEWTKGNIPGVDVPAKGSAPLDIPVRISLGEVRKTIFDLLKKGSNVQYALRLTMQVVSENKMIDKSEVVLESSGTVKSVIKAGESLEKENL